MGSTLGDGSGIIQHDSCNKHCPDECNSAWETYKKTSDPWRVDQSLKVSCGKNNWFKLNTFKLKPHFNYFYFTDCCSRLGITSSGWSREKWTKQWGVYEYSGKHNGWSFYKHISQEMFLYRDSNDRWMVR